MNLINFYFILQSTAKSAEEDLSIAAAKPIALAVAGKDGLAAASPLATSVVGEGGIAISEPQAVAVTADLAEQAEIKS